MRIAITRAERDLSADIWLAISRQPGTRSFLLHAGLIGATKVCGICQEAGSFPVD